MTAYRTNLCGERTQFVQNPKSIRMKGRTAVFCFVLLFCSLVLEVEGMAAFNCYGCTTVN